ncbi:MAG: hypothetical protein BVN35_08180 [Proteobacteria bacterium ST_bin11]|nr:MAG: hypothetical protein BVN35_08180 [Proteobacteria bacterium ST_bin11]
MIRRIVWFSHSKRIAEIGITDHALLFTIAPKERFFLKTAANEATRSQTTKTGAEFSRSVCSNPAALNPVNPFKNRIQF